MYIPNLKKKCLKHLLGGIPCARGDAFYPRIIVLTDGVATPQHVTGNKDFTPEMSDILKVYFDLIYKRIVFINIVYNKRTFIFKDFSGNSRCVVRNNRTPRQSIQCTSWKGG